MNTKLKLMAAIVLLTGGLLSNANGQAYKADYATKLVLAGNGTDVANTFTLTAPTLAGSLSLRLPATNGTSGYILTTDGAGVTSWTNPSTGVALSGDINGTAGATTINSANAGIGGRLATALNTASANSVNGDVLKYNASLTVASNLLGINLANANTWTATQTFPVTSAQGDALMASLNASTSLLAIAHGGTNSTATPTAGAIAYGTGTAYAFSAVGTAGQILKSNAAGAPTWVDISTLGITSIVGTAPISANTVSGVATISVASSDLTSTPATSAITVTGGTGKLLTGTGASISLATDATLKVATSQLGIDLAHANTWTATQTLPTTGAQGNNIVGGLNNATASTLNADVLKYDATLKVATNQIGIDLTHANTWTGIQTISGAGKFKYTGNGETAGYVLTTDAAGVASWTNPSSSVSLTGDVSGTAGANTINPANAGVGGRVASALNTAAANAVNGDVVNHDATLTVATNKLGVDLAHANSWTAAQTFSAATVTAQTLTTAAPAALAAATNNWSVDLTTGSVFLVNQTTPATLTGIAGGTSGRRITVINNGTSYITITSEDALSTATNRFHFFNNDLMILGPDGSATFAYDGTRWRLVASN